MSGQTPDRVFGLAEVRRTLQADRGGLLTAAAYVVPIVQTVPTLVEMTAGAINVLEKDPEGLPRSAVEPCRGRPPDSARRDV
jgi:alkaline phosphatase